MHRETGDKKRNTKHLHSNGHLPEILLTVGKKKPKATRENIKEIISKSYKVQMLPSASQRIFKNTLSILKYAIPPL